MTDGVNLKQILAEVRKATAAESRASLLGASRDGTFNRFHRTLRISQADVRWLWVLQVLFHKIGSRSWIYREGSWDVWVIESTCRLTDDVGVTTPEAKIAFIRGFFDAEGSIPRQAQARFYIQLVQKNLPDLERVRTMLLDCGIRCGMVHNPSARVDPEYWRFYILSGSCQDFIRHSRVLACCGGAPTCRGYLRSGAAHRGWGVVPVRSDP